MSITFGPINSRRFGKSLGVDLSPNAKQCNFDCLYCELKATKTVSKYSDIVSVQDVVKEIKSAIKENSDIDFITLTANGEPTLYPYLNELIDEINSFKGDIKTLILSNSSTINDKQIQQALCKLDVVKLSLDCATTRCFKRLDRADGSVSLEDIKKGLQEFVKLYKGTLQIEILFVKGVNDKPQEIKELNSFLKNLKPTVIDISTIDRPPAYKVEPLSYDELHKIALEFDSSLNVNIASKKRDVKSKFNYTKEQIIQTLKRRPLTKEDVNTLFNKTSLQNLEELEKENKIELKSGFYKAV
jgi:wyosine [tRNA(Phe)-imidazoG37] synthetase (radical SAM superfamily)